MGGNYLGLFIPGKRRVKKITYQYICIQSTCQSVVNPFGSYVFGKSESASPSFPITINTESGGADFFDAAAKKTPLNGNNISCMVKILHSYALKPVSGLAKLRREAPSRQPFPKFFVWHY